MDEREWVVDVAINYFQIVVWRAEDDPGYSDWSKAHTEQGFVWRPETVSFHTPWEPGEQQEENGDRGPFIRIRLSERFDPPADATRIIKVPFEVHEHGVIVSSILSEEVACDIPLGLYALFFTIEPNSEAIWFDPHAYSLVFVPAREPVEAEIIRADASLRPPTPLLMTGERAWDGRS